MKLNQNTIDTLKNFAGINTNILIKEGDELSTISTMRNIFAKAKISDQFTNEFGIYDLNEFLSAVSGFSKPELSLQDKYMTISSEGSKSKVKYFYSDPSVIVSPTKEVNMPEAEVTFSLTESNYKELLKMAAILKSPDLALIGTKGGDIVLNQREAVNSAWDKPVKETWRAFIATHPQWADYTIFDPERDSSFNWKWYYAFQQVGDQTASDLSKAYQAATLQKDTIASYVALLSPSLLAQRLLSSAADTNVSAMVGYENDVRAFHKVLRKFYYYHLFNCLLYTSPSPRDRG